MEELKACPYSDAELKGAIDRMTIAANRKSPLYLWPIDCHVALWALTNINRRTAPENKPLTLEQLRQMDGEPVWVVHPNMKGWFEYNKEAGWYILEHFFGGGIGIKDSKMDTPLSKESSYGRDWIAYARKPEQEAAP